MNPLRHALRWLAAPHVLVPVAALVALALMWGVTFNTSRTEEKRAHETSLLATERLVDTYEAQTLRALNEINQNLKLIAYARRFAGKGGDFAELHAQNLLLPKLLFTTRLVDSQGRVLASSRSDGAGESVSGELLAHHAAFSELFVSRPYQPAGGGEAVMDISRRVDDGDGSEIVVITMPVSYLVSDHDTQRFGNAGVLAVIGQDGVVRAMRTGEQVTSGAKVDFSQVLPQDEAEVGEAALRPTPWGREPRYIGSRPLYGFPLAVVVALSEGERLQDVRAEADARNVRSVGITVVVLGLALALSVLTRKVQVLREREQAERAENARRIEHMAYHDSLTSLPNRAHFGRRLAEMSAAWREKGEPFALMLLDLDGFKKVNDVLGHQAGDLLLTQVAQRLSRAVRQGDFVARLGGDEFVVLAQLGQASDDVDLLACRLVASIGQPYELDGSPAAVTASIGVALCPQDGQTDAALTQRADEAMYLAKQRGKNGVVHASRRQQANDPFAAIYSQH